jgi:hypothetical protein
VRAAASVVLAAALLLAGCGGDGRREAVDDYIEQVDRAQASLLGKKGQIDLVLARFDLVDPKAGTSPPSTVPTTTCDGPRRWCGRSSLRATHAACTATSCGCSSSRPT